jgi:hypothetical protein
MRSGRVLPFAGSRALRPGDLQAIARFAAAQPRARMQFAELDKGRTVALLEVGARRVRLERHGETVLARLASGGPPLERGCIDALLTAVQVWLSSRSYAGIWVTR